MDIYAIVKLHFQTTAWLYPEGFLQVSVGQVQIIPFGIQQWQEK